MASLSIKESLLRTAQIIKQYVDDKISGIDIPSLDGYATEEYVDNATTNAVLKTPQELTVEEAEQVRVNIKTIGKDMTGIVQTPYTIEETSEELIRHYTDPVEGGEYAEVYNDPENVATGAYSNAKGYMTQATGDYSESSGWATIASGIASKASGLLAVASGPYAIAEGTRVQATKNNAHAEGDGCIASGNNAHAEGYRTNATTNQAHSEGGFTTASGVYSHAEGEYSTASARGAHAEGFYTVASGRNSFAAGEYTKAAGRAQFVIGKYNTSNSTDIFIIGNGTADTTEGRKNAFTIDPNGNTWIAGNVTVGADKKGLATQEYVDSLHSVITEEDVDSIIGDIDN